MRSVAVITPPSATPVDVETARRSLGLDEDDAAQEDMERLIEAATGQIDGPTGWLGRALITQTLELRLDGIGCDYRSYPDVNGIRLPYPPVASIVSVKYDDLNGTEQTWDPVAYRLITSSGQPLLVCKSGQSWPSNNGDPESIRIRYTCGYGPAPENVPAAIRQAILVMVQQSWSLGERNLFTSAETIDGVGSAQYIVTDNAAKVMKDAAENLLATYRVYE